MILTRPGETQSSFLTFPPISFLYPIEMDGKYEIVLLGATGYTAAICAEYLAANLPTNFNWAIAGRSASKLDLLALKLDRKYPDRRPPGN